MVIEDDEGRFKLLTNLKVQWLILETWSVGRNSQTEARVSIVATSSSAVAGSATQQFHAQYFYRKRHAADQIAQF